MASSGDNVDHLKLLIGATLEQRGVLARIRAELRQQVFLALDEAESKQHAADLAGDGASSGGTSPRTRGYVSAKKKKISELQSSSAALEALEIVRDFLDAFELDYSSALLHTEAGVTASKVNRKQLADKYSLAPVSGQPLLLELLQRQSGGGGSDRARSTADNAPAATSSTTATAGRLNRALYREPAPSEDSPRSNVVSPAPAPSVTVHDRSRSLDADPLRTAKPLEERLSPREKLSPRREALAPLGAIKKTTLGSLAPLGSKSSLPSLSAPLSSKPALNLSAAPEKKVSPVPSPKHSSVSPTAPSSFSSSSASNSAAASAPGAQPAASSSSSAPSRAAADELDLDALESDLFGGSSPNNGTQKARGGETFLPGGDEDDSYSSSLSPSSRSAGPAHSSAPLPPKSSSSTLSSLSAAPSLKSGGGGLGRNSWAAPTAPSALQSSLNESLPEEDARQVAALDKKIASLSAPSATVSVQRAEDSYGEDFATSGGVEEELEIEAESDHYDEEEF